MYLEFERELTDRRFAEIGKPYRLFRDDRGWFIAICSAFELISWPGRYAHEGQQLRHRISIYSAGTSQRLAVLDLTFPVNDIAFHPVRAEIAIGSGSYDGGFFFAGELLVWNWEAAIKRSLLVESREVVRCRYSGQNQITFLLRPQNEEQYESGDPFDTYIGAVIDDLREPLEIFPERPEEDPRLADLQPSDPAQWGFAHPEVPSDDLTPAELAELEGRGFEERHFIGDLAWLDDRTFVAVHRKCHAEVWDIEEGRQARITGKGYGAEIILQHRCLIHVFQPGDSRTSGSHRSSLFELRGGGLKLLREFTNGCTFSYDFRGNLLARDIGDYVNRGRPRKDRAIDPTGKIFFEGDLGAMDGWNHSLRLNGGADLYFLRGTPPGSHLHKVLCALDRHGVVREIFAWDRVETQMMNPFGIFVGDFLVRAGQIYKPNSSERIVAVECLSMHDGKTFWSAPFSGCIVSLAAGDRWIAYSQTSGGLGLIDPHNGKILAQIDLSFSDAPTIATALAVQGNRLLVGTIDGRLLLYRVVG